MPPPFYADIGQRPRDILNCGYHFGLVKLDCKLKQHEHIALSLGGTYTIDTKTLTGYAGANGSTDSFGLGIKWNGDLKNRDGNFQNNTITGEAIAKDQYIKLSLDATTDVKSGFVGGHVKNAFRDDHMAFNLETELKKDGPFLVEGAIALEYQGLAGGIQLAYDAPARQFIKNNIAVEFSHGDATIGGKIENEKIFGILGAYKFNDRIEAAAEVNWNNEESETSGTIGAKYELTDYHTTVRAKINNEIGIGLSLAYRFKDTVTVTGSALADCKNIGNDPDHKVGLALEVEI